MLGYEWKLKVSNDIVSVTILQMLDFNWGSLSSDFINNITSNRHTVLPQTSSSISLG